ncbi:SDR family oxidoreductase [Rhizobium vallis]|uniref:SDR family oxidoreductase n=1 Tax=Rhizobium vallis TaxID=634290 RepID=A0A432PT73_9HYPH|nr:SDR family oxidoreductase [Rhizobium vallis]RUM27116.1 SDR family oxidoreductase [Rhizobium vallis]
MTLWGKHIVVTGGGSGVGAETAKVLALAGASVTIIGRREAQLRAQSLPYQICDVTDSVAVAEAFDIARTRSGPITGVVASAGAAESAPFQRTGVDAFRSMIDVNLIGVVNVWQAALPDMKKAGWGRMIAIASTAGLKGYSYVSAYCAAKHAVIGLTRALAQELATSGITVNAICPGFVDTPMLERSVEHIMAKTGMSREKALQSLAAVNPQNRFVQPVEVAQTALWLCSEAATSVNGHALALSGGET